MSKFRMNRSPATVIALAALVVALAGGAYAAIPAADGTIKACYATTDGLLGIPHNKGDLRAIDSGESCRSYEKPLSWSQRPPSATMFARVSGGGTLLGGSPGVTSMGLAGVDGIYYIAFPTSVKDCAATATPAQGALGVTTTYTEVGSPNTLIARAYTVDGTPTAIGVNVIVVCPGAP